MKEVIQLGMRAKDKVTGFTGIIIGKAIYLYGCTQYGLLPESKEGKASESAWFDEGRVEVIGSGVLPEDVRVERNGGPNMDGPKGIQ